MPSAAEEAYLPKLAEEVAECEASLETAVLCQVPEKAEREVTSVFSCLETCHHAPVTFLDQGQFPKLVLEPGAAVIPVGQAPAPDFVPTNHHVVCVHLGNVAWTQCHGDAVVLEEREGACVRGFCADFLHDDGGYGGVLKVLAAMGVL